MKKRKLENKNLRVKIPDDVIYKVVKLRYKSSQRKPESWSNISRKFA